MGGREGRNTTVHVPLVLVLKRSKVADSGCGEGGGAAEGKGQIALHNQSFSDEEDELLQFTSPLSDDGVDPNAKFNRSWIRYVCVF